MTFETRPSLLLRATERDEHAWRSVVDIYTPLLLAWCRRNGLSETDAQDVAQDVFVTLAKSLGDFSKQESSDSFRAWLSSITRSRIVDFHRRRAKSPVAHGGSTANLLLQESPDLEDSISLDISESDRKQILRRALYVIQSDFDEPTWKAFWKTAIDGHDATTVSQELGVTSNAVRKSKARVLKRLREEMAGIYE
jgi:RNA polymerase sigma-70 factor, ECF subfamily